MAHFRVFLPGATTADPNRLKRVGLEHLIPGAVFLLNQQLNDVNGAIVSWNNEDPGLSVDGFSWIPAYASGDLPEGRYLVGLPIESPRPDELEWPKMFGGYLVTLGDGNSWCIPSAGMLPQTVKMRSNGQASRQVRKEFQKYFDDSVKWFADFISRDFDDVNQTFDSEIFNYLARALMLNYRLTPEVISELELFGTENLVTCLRVSVDGLKIAEEINEMAQKKSSDPIGG